jgi:hypothetical protein
MGFTLQSVSPPRSRTSFDARSLPAVLDIAFLCSEDQKITMPRSFKVLLPAEIRTPERPKPSGADTLLGFVRLSRACPFRRRPGFPGLSLLRFLRPLSGREGARRSRALSNGRGAAGLATRDNSLEVLHQNPALGFSREPWCPTDESVGQEHPCDAEPIRSRRTRPAAPPEGGARNHSEELVRRRPNRTGPEGPARSHHPEVTPGPAPKSSSGGLHP